MRFCPSPQREPRHIIGRLQRVVAQLDSQWSGLADSVEVRGECHAACRAAPSLWQLGYPLADSLVLGHHKGVLPCTGGTLGLTAVAGCKRALAGQPLAMSALGDALAQRFASLVAVDVDDIDQHTVLGGSLDDCTGLRAGIDVGSPGCEQYYGTCLVGRLAAQLLDSLFQCPPQVRHIGGRGQLSFGLGCDLLAHVIKCADKLR